MKNFNVAVVGATGLVGSKMMQVLEENNFPVDNFYPMASARSKGKKVTFMGKEYEVEELSEHSFDKPIDFAIFSAGAGTSKTYAPIAAQHGTIVIDNSSCWRMQKDIPLVVPEVNSQAAFNHKNIIANPNCSTIQAVVALKPLEDKYKIKRIVYTTFQAVAGSGIKGIEDLRRGLRGEENQFYPKQIAFNCLPHIDAFTDDGYTKEEHKMIDETRKILGRDDIQITATTVRVPVEIGHSESINVELENDFELADIFELYNKMPGVILMDDIKNGVYPTAIDAKDRDEVFVGRIRRDFSCPKTLNLWVVADNIRKGAATNAVQIAMLLAKKESE